MPSMIRNHFHSPVVHETMHSASVFRVWITPIVARPTEITHPAANTTVSGYNDTFLV